MDNLKPPEAVAAVLEAGAAKAALPVKDLMIRGLLSGALLGVSTTLAITASMQTGVALVGALVFPVGFAMIILLGLDLLTGSFAVVTVAGADGRAAWGRVSANFAWVFLANLLGSVAYGGLFYLASSWFGTDATSPIGARIAALAEAKTAGYAAHGAAGMATVFVKAILCNWMVCLGAVLPFTARSTVGKIAACWLPVFTFFAQGFEHSVVNMFVIPTGILFGAKVTIKSWWAWNQIPVTLGNLVGGALFTGLFLYWTYAAKPAGVRPADASLGTTEPAVS